MAVTAKTKLQLKSVVVRKAYLAGYLMFLRQKAF